MTSAAQKLLEQCLALPEDERLLVADELMASVDRDDPSWQVAWAEEAARRSRAADEHGDRGRPWATVKADLLAKLAQG